MLVCAVSIEAPAGRMSPQSAGGIRDGDSVHADPRISKAFLFSKASVCSGTLNGSIGLECAFAECGFVMPVLEPLLKIHPEKKAA